MQTRGLLAAAAALACVSAAGQVVQPNLTVPEGNAIVSLYATGEVLSLPSETKWRYMCGSDTTGLTAADLAEVVADHQANVAAAEAGLIPVLTVDSGAARGGLNVIFNVIGSPPSGAVAALAVCEQVIESNFLDNSTVTVTVEFAPLGSGVLGATGSNYVQATYAAARTGLVNGADGDDTTQAFLPTGTTIPIRYNASSTTTTNEDRVFFTRSNFRSTVGAVSGTDASITISTNFSFDFNPDNGVVGTSFNDVMIHEVGHAMGFTSGVDFRTNDVEALDLWRFQFTDGSGDFNPDSLAEFQTTPRTVDFNNLNDDVISDTIEAEYRMSDGSPSQASHFREQGGCGSFPSQIGLMDPSLAGGCTYAGRGYYSVADIAMFDAIGYDVVEGNPPVITTQPGFITVCQGDTAQLSIVATGDGLTFQWFTFPANTPVSGQTTPTLTLNNVQPSQSGFYFCRVTGTLGVEDSDSGTITVNPDPAITGQPQPQTVTEGDPASFSVTATSATGFQWRKDGVNISGATSSTFNIASTVPGDMGNYSVVVTNMCGSVTSSNALLTVNELPQDCLADVNGDGDATPADFSAWITAFNAQGPGCDQNGDGLCTPADFSSWITNFNAGCP